MAEHKAQSNFDTALAGDQAAYLEEVFEQFQQDPAAVPDSWKSYFQGVGSHGSNGAAAVATTANSAAASQTQTKGIRPEQTRVSRLINSYRYSGHLKAKLNPLGDYIKTNEVPELDLAYHELEGISLDEPFDPGSFHLSGKPTLGNIFAALQETYCGSLGFEYMHMADLEEKRWLQARIEPNRGKPDLTEDQRRHILKLLSGAEGFEQFLHRKYVGQKRFGLEGGESLIPLMHTLIQDGGSQGMKEMVIAMAHRGRLNVLTNILCKSPQSLFDEFDGKAIDPDQTGDVKYHNGYSSDVMTPGGPVHLALSFNPSHLEIVSPVVEGSVRSRQERRGDKTGDQVMAIIIHGDAAFAGQGVVMETFNMAKTRGFKTHGSIHIVVNNQIGFTTSTVADTRSTVYPTDVAKMISAPIIHVNGDDPEAVVYAAQIASEYRQTFHKDIVIDLICYRRLGHNEADEPAMTQPVMYRVIKQLATTRKQYAERLVEEKVLSDADSKALIDEYRDLMDQGESTYDYINESSSPAPKAEMYTHWNKYFEGGWTDKVPSAISLERIERLSSNWLTNVPEDFEVHRRVLKVFEERVEMGKGERPADWGFGETLAYASLVEDGVKVRLCGQDSGRGTFSHRHAVLHNQKQREQWIPLQHQSDDQADFTVIDSLLSEEAVLAFEYGFSSTDPEVLVLWEAQFGDFVNGAQVVIDQFISSAEQKWNRLCGLVMLLPHGMEGQGPEHSSGRIERFMQLAAQENMQIAVPSTPAQIFHLLRRQMLRDYRKPLIIFSPKSLLRHPLAINDRADFSEGYFQNVIDDPALTSKADKDKVNNILMCSGKVFYDLLEAREERKITDTAIIRIEQLYPFPDEELLALAASYPNAKARFWVQEEPINQGAWDSILPRFEIRCDWHDVECISRPAMAAPAVGHMMVHKQQQQVLMDDAFKASAD